MVLFLEPHHIYLAFFFGLFTTTAIGWLLALRNAKTSRPLRSLRIVVWGSVVSSVLFGVSGLLPMNTDQDLQTIVLVLAFVSIFAQILRYPLHEAAFKYHLNIYDLNLVPALWPNLAERIVEHDRLEQCMEVVLWLLSLKILNRGIFPPVAGLVWNIGGGIAMARLCDVFTAVGIGIHPKIRLVFLWTARFCLTAGLLIWVSSLTPHFK